MDDAPRYPRYDANRAARERWRASQAGWLELMQRTEPRFTGTDGAFPTTTPFARPAWSSAAPRAAALHVAISGAAVRLTRGGP